MAMNETLGGPVDPEVLYAHEVAFLDAFEELDWLCAALFGDDCFGATHVPDEIVARVTALNTLKNWYGDRPIYGQRTTTWALESPIDGRPTSSYRNNLRGQSIIGVLKEVVIVPLPGLPGEPESVTAIPALHIDSHRRSSLASVRKAFSRIPAGGELWVPLGGVGIGFEDV